MSNVIYYEQALEKLDITWNGDIKVLVDVISKMYGSCYQTKEFVGDAADDLAAIGLLSESSGMYTCSDVGDELVETAASLFIAAEKPEMLEKKSGSRKRELGDDMTAHKDYVLECLEGKIEVKDVGVYRTNYFVNFHKSIKGIKCIEVKNRPEIRICVRKASGEVIAHFASIGMKYRTVPAQTYFDMPRTKENIEKLVDAIVKYFNEGI